MSVDDSWDVIITSNPKKFDFQFKLIWKYRDLLKMLIKRDFVAFYKQTILGPFWFLIQPLITIVIYVFLFGTIANISTGEIPMPLFYLSGIMAWAYFSETMIKVANVFRDNASIFSKVFFPRMIIPLSIISSNLIKLGIQFFLMVLLLVYYFLKVNFFTLNFYVLLIPVVILLIGILGMAIGLIVTSLTTKYRDFALLLSMGTTLLMYTCPVVYPIDRLNDSVRLIVNINPMTTFIEMLRFCLFAKGEFTQYGLVYSVGLTLFLLVYGVITFNKAEKNFIDTV
jgi:lipopolysaccharide transport system permease protein